MNDLNMESWIGTLPKTELHLHIEGTFEPELMFVIAKRNDVKLRFDNVEEVLAAYRFQNLQSFLDIYYDACSVLLEEQDFFDLTWAYLERAANENIRHVEIFFDPQAHTARDVPFKTVITGIHKALAQAETNLGISSKLIMCFLRHLSAESSMKILEESLPYKNLITAVGLDSSEKGNPPNKFTEVFEQARAAGYLAVAHAGEEGNADTMRQALDLLKVSRIDHGIHCLDDTKLIARLVQDRIPLTVCPLSNIALRVVDSLESHPLKKMLDLGLCVTINSDDPAFFGGYLTENIVAAQKALKLSQNDIITLLKNGFEASFLTPEEKQKYLDELTRRAS
jgi:adenosine deaminase